ncbi:MAG: alanine racemase [Kineosporiaceae bacterium]
MSDSAGPSAPPSSGPPVVGEAVVDLDAIAGNVSSLARSAAGAEVMAVVKADAYGHGLVPAARAALAGGAAWLGVAQLDEAIALREAGVTAPVLAWLLGPGSDLEAGVRHRVTLGVASGWALAAAAAAARATGQVADVHVKIDTGLSRNGVTMGDWPATAERAAALEADGLLAVTGLFSHLALADAPSHPTVDRQAAAFAEAIRIGERAGLRPQLRHLANSAATLLRPDLHYDLVRPGIAVYGLSPAPELVSPAEAGLVPAMTLRALLTQAKRVPAGSGVSYGHEYTTTCDTVLGLVPLGYADGLPRSASGRGPLLVRSADAARRLTVAGRVCMDQVVVDLGPGAGAVAGDEVLVWGPGTRGEPTAQDWAVAAGTISYEIVTRIGTRLPRRHVGAAGAIGGLAVDSLPALDGLDGLDGLVVTGP